MIFFFLHYGRFIYQKYRLSGCEPLLINPFTLILFLKIPIIIIFIYILGRFEEIDFNVRI